MKSSSSPVTILALVALTGCESAVGPESNGWARWMVIGSVVTFVGSIIALPFLVAFIPQNYFAQPTPPPSRWKVRHPALRWSILIIRNLIGFTLIVLGIVLIPLPGQGILIALVGIGFANFPGKRAVELWIVQRPRFKKALQWIRHKSGREPLVILERTPEDG